MRYSLLLHNHEPEPGEVSAEDWARFQTYFDEYGKALDAAGVLLAAEILKPSEVTTTVSVRNGTSTVQDGPFADTKEALAGVFLVDVPDLDAAIAWAEKCPGAQYGAVEVRPSAVWFANGRWND